MLASDHYSVSGCGLYARPRVIKGVKFFDHVDAGDPVEQARSMMPPKPTNSCFMTSPPATRGGASWPTWCVRWRIGYSCPSRWAEASARLDDATGLIQAGAEKVQHELCRGQAAETAGRDFAEIWPLRHSAGCDANRVTRRGRTKNQSSKKAAADSCLAARGWTIRAGVGGSLGSLRQRRAAWARGSTYYGGRGKPSGWVRVKLSQT